MAVPTHEGDEAKVGLPNVNVYLPAANVLGRVTVVVPFPFPAVGKVIPYIVATETLPDGAA